MNDPTPEERAPTETNWRKNVCPACNTHHPNGWACPKDLAVLREDNARLREELRTAVEDAIKKNNYAWELEVVKAEEAAIERCAKVIEDEFDAPANVAAAIRALKKPADE